MNENQKQNLNEVFSDDLEMSHAHGQFQECSDPEDSEKYFTQVIGCIEEIIMKEEYSNLRYDFLEKYWPEFDDNEENKLIYTEIFSKYTNLIEKYIEDELRKSVMDFDMEKFECLLKARMDEVDVEIFEMLKTFTDFMAFKSMFLDYKAEKEGRSVDFSQDLYVKRYNFQNRTKPEDDKML